MVEITTDRLLWRRPAPADLDAMHAIASEYEVVKQTATWPWPPDRAFTESRCQAVDLSQGLIGLVFRGTDLVGMMGLHAPDTTSQTGATSGAGFGYMFARAHWGQGYATEMGVALIAEAFTRYDWPAIEACVFDDNPGSARVLEKLGFAATGSCSGPSAAQGLTLATRTFRLARP